MKLSIRSFVKDSILNIFVTFVPLVVLQFIVYPILAGSMTQEQYGTMISCYSLMYLIGGTLGTELNRVRLVGDAAYAKEGLKGDFNIVLLGNIIIGFISCVIFGNIFIDGMNVTDIALLSMTCVFIILNSYLEVGFRLILNYKHIAVVQLINVIGYILGVFLFMLSDMWIFVYLSGLILGFIYLIKFTSLIKEPLRKTHFFKKTLFDDINLAFSGFLNRVLLYGDKILLLPLGGSEMVSIYYIATLIGKTVLMSIEPINTVMLSYLVKMKTISMKNFQVVIILLSTICAIGYAVCMVISKPLLNFLYPMWAEETTGLIWMVTLAMCISAMGNVINSFVLKECTMQWQTIINSIVIIVFIVLAVLLINIKGLFGYCIAVTVAYTVRLAIIIGVYYYQGKKRSV